MTWRKILGGELGPLIAAGVAIVAMGVSAALVCLVKISLLSPAAAAPARGGTDRPQAHCLAAEDLAAVLQDEGYAPLWYGDAPFSSVALYVALDGSWALVEVFSLEEACVQRAGEDNSMIEDGR